MRYIDAELIAEWQTQASLVCSIPNLRGHDAQILVACDFTAPAQISESSVGEILASATRAGKRVLRGSSAPDQEEIADWIAWAGQARQVPAAA